MWVDLHESLGCFARLLTNDGPKKDARVDEQDTILVGCLSGCLRKSDSSRNA